MTKKEVLLAARNGTLEELRGQWISDLIHDEGYIQRNVEAIFANCFKDPDDPENKEEMTKFQACRKKSKAVVDAFIESCGCSVK